MSFQSCPHCLGEGWIRYFGIECPVCKGKRIINEQTGKPPEEKNIQDNTAYGGIQGDVPIFQKNIDLARGHQGPPDKPITFAEDLKE